MISITMQSFAIEMQMPLDHLIQQFLDIGILKTKFDSVTQIEKESLLKHIRCSQLTTTINKFSLQRKTRSTLNISTVGGKNKQVQVEVRKKRVYTIGSISQKSDSVVLLRKLKSNTQTTSGNTLSNPILKEKSMSHANLTNIINSPLALQKFSKKDHIITADLVKTKKLDLDNNDSTVSEKNKKSFNIEKRLINKENTSHAWDTDISVMHVKKSTYNTTNIKSDISIAVETTKNHDSHHSKLDHDRRHSNSRLRVRYRTAGKITKQKRNNNYRLYVDMINECDKEELPIPNRVIKNKQRKQSALIQSFNKPDQIVTKDVVIGESISVLELSNKMSIKSSYMIKVMMQLGLMVTINQVLDQETAQLVIEEMGHNAILRKSNELEELIMDDYRNNITDVNINMQDHIFYKNRAPVVTVMGHVDHGKTSLLDYIRSSNVVSFEAGGITQNIGAYRVNTPNGGMITFLDTPGHAAFTNMRARGMQLTDIAVLVVAIDDGVMPQTIESIQYIKSANVPVVVAINKIDKQQYNNVDRIKHELHRYGLVSEDWGGSTQFVNVSAISGAGVSSLLDAILLQADMLELKVIHYGMAKAIVIESSLDKGRGPVVTVLIKEGILKCGDVVLCGREYGRIRAMRDECGYDITSAGPSMPVELLGLSGIPSSGEMMIVARNEKVAREVAVYRQEKYREIKLARKQSGSDLGNVFSNIYNNTIAKIPELNFIIKSDTQGSVEAIYESLKKLSTSEVIIKIISASIGNVTETDSILASTSNAIILAFNVRADFAARRIIESDHIDVRYYSVIYDLLNVVKKMMNDVLVPKYTYKVLGVAEVHSIFRSPKYGNIAGCMVIDGIIKSHKKIKIIRDNIVIYEGELESLRRFKNEVNEVKVGIECGICIKNYDDIQVKDILEVLDSISETTNL